MEALLIYLLKSALWMGIFWAIYHFFLKKESFFRFNRTFLLAGMILSLLFPLMQYRYTVEVPIAPPVETNNEVDWSSRLVMSDELLFNQTELPAEVSTTNPIDWRRIVLFVLLLGVAFHLLRYAVSYVRLNRLLRGQDVDHYKGIKVVYSTKIPSSLSFLNYMLIDKRLTSTEIERLLIFEHEAAHVKQRHWVDLLLAQLVCSVMWFNPFSWLLLNAIKENQEYLADRAVLEQGYSPAVYQAALINYEFKAPVFQLSNYFSHRSKSKRITMMKKQISKPMKKWAALLVVPCVAVFLWAFAMPEYKEVIEEKTPKEEVVAAINKHLSQTTPGIVSMTTSSGDDVAPSNTSQFVNEAKAIIAVGDTVAPTNFSEFWIRGVSSFGANDQALVIIDGEEGSFDDLNVDDIKSFSVLKDVSGTAVYGEKGKNGVVVIETKTKAAEKNRLFDIMFANANINKDSVIVVVDGEQKGYMKDFGKEIFMEEVESFSILKDSSAIKVFGDEAKNGVVVIESKGKATNQAKRIEIMLSGELKQHGKYVLQVEEPSVEIALATIGFTKDADMTDITVLREKDGIKETYSLDSCSPEYKKSPGYILEDGDIIYVSPKKSKEKAVSKNPVPASLLEKATLLLVDEKEVAWKDINLKTVKYEGVMTPTEATARYGQKGKNGVIRFASTNGWGINEYTLFMNLRSYGIRAIRGEEANDILFFMAEEKGMQDLLKGQKQISQLDDRGISEQTIKTNPSHYARYIKEVNDQTWLVIDKKEIGYLKNNRKKINVEKINELTLTNIDATLATYGEKAKRGVMIIEYGRVKDEDFIERKWNDKYTKESLLQAERKASNPIFLTDSSRVFYAGIDKGTLAEFPFEEYEISSYFGVKSAEEAISHWGEDVRYGCLFLYPKY